MANENSTRNDGDVWACDFFVLFCFELFLKFRILRKENSRNYGLKRNLRMIKKLFIKKKKKKKELNWEWFPNIPDGLLKVEVVMKIVIVVKMLMIVKDCSASSQGNHR
jgi:hypothetical protein